MKVILIINLLCICLFLQTQARIIHMIFSAQKTAYFQCYRQTTGLNKIILRLVDDGKQIQNEYIQSISNALATGLKVEAFHLPDPSDYSVDQLIKMYRKVHWNYVDKLWLSMYSLHYTPPEVNCRFLIELTERLGSELKV